MAPSASALSPAPAIPWGPQAAPAPAPQPAAALQLRPASHRSLGASPCPLRGFKIRTHLLLELGKGQPDVFLGDDQGLSVGDPLCCGFQALPHGLVDKTMFCEALDVAEAANGQGNGVIRLSGTVGRQGCVEMGSTAPGQASLAPRAGSWRGGTTWEGLLQKLRAPAPAPGTRTQ